MNHPPGQTQTISSLEKRYDILHTQFRELVNVYFKGSSMMLAIIGVSLGYLLKVDLVPTHGRVLAGTVVLISVFWYICSIAALRMSRSIRRSICASAAALNLPYEPREYSALNAIIVAAFSCMAPIVAVFVYFILIPPAMGTD